jgi:hypothetical protein
LSKFRPPFYKGIELIFLDVCDIRDFVEVEGKSFPVDLRAGAAKGAA